MIHLPYSNSIIRDFKCLWDFIKPRFCLKAAKIADIYAHFSQSESIEATENRGKIPVQAGAGISSGPDLIHA